MYLVNILLPNPSFSCGSDEPTSSLSCGSGNAAEGYSPFFFATFSSLPSLRWQRYKENPLSLSFRRRRYPLLSLSLHVGDPWVVVVMGTGDVEPLPWHSLDATSTITRMGDGRSCFFLQISLNSGTRTLSSLSLHEPSYADMLPESARPKFLDLCTSTISTVVLYCFIFRCDCTSNQIGEQAGALTQFSKYL